MQRKKPVHSARGSKPRVQPNKKVPDPIIKFSGSPKHRAHSVPNTKRKKEADVIGLIVVGALVICTLSAFSILGPFGRGIDFAVSSLLGPLRFGVYLFIGTYAVAMMFETRRSLPKRYLSSGSLSLFFLMGLTSLYYWLVRHVGVNTSFAMRGGVIGYYSVHSTATVLSVVGASLVFLFGALFSLLDFFGRSPVSVVRDTRGKFEQLRVRSDEQERNLESSLDVHERNTEVIDLTQLETIRSGWRARGRRNKHLAPRPMPYDYEDDDANEGSGEFLTPAIGSVEFDHTHSDSGPDINSRTDTGVEHGSGLEKNHVKQRRVVPSKSVSDGEVSPALASSHVSWKLPSPSILKRSAVRSLDKDELWKRGRVLAEALATHKVETTLVGMTVGPTVTRYELELGAGVKVARVTSLHKDIAYAMAAADVRMLAPIPGRSAIGVEVPNERRVTVSLGDVLLAPEVANIIHPLSVAIGRDISGRATMVNLAEMPHVLIAGSTGSGKSSCLNSLLSSVLMRSTPDEVRLILVDPKRVELGQYNGVPHLLTPVVTNPKKAANALAWAVKEMERRYDLLSELGARDIVGYNQTVANLVLDSIDDPSESLAASSIDSNGDEIQFDHSPLFASVEEKKYVHLPYILVVVDELNDLMMVAARDVEDSICRIAQMARAVGIHLVIATQRPSVDVITGLIKANVPSRMAFSVSSLADSRVILDQPGAERLIGKGDMLMLAASSSHPQRLQAPWVTEEEVRKIVAHWLRQGKIDTAPEFDTVDSSSPYQTPDEGQDELYGAALSLVVSSQLGSTSMLQRKLKVGFSRAGRLMDLLESRGVVGPLEGSKPRVVLMSKEEYEEYQGAEA